MLLTLLVFKSIFVEENKAVDTNGKTSQIGYKEIRGNHAEYQAFWDSFDAAIHSNETLSDIEKLNYLRSFLEDPAVETIAGLALTKDNYKVAVDLLRERYGNKQVIISSHKLRSVVCRLSGFKLKVMEVC